MYKWVDKNKLMQRLADGAYIPVAPDNVDYQAALAWVVQGNVIPDPDPPSPAELAETARLVELDAQMNSPLVTNLKGMNNTEFNAWWGINITNLAQLNGMVKLLARIIIRRVL